jgi:hypothetical protein
MDHSHSDAPSFSADLAACGSWPRPADGLWCDKAALCLFHPCLCLFPWGAAFPLALRYKMPQTQSTWQVLLSDPGEQWERCWPAPTCWFVWEWLHKCLGSSVSKDFQRGWMAPLGNASLLMSCELWVMENQALRNKLLPLIPLWRTI